MSLLFPNLQEVPKSEFPSPQYFTAATGLKETLAVVFPVAGHTI